MRTTAALLFVIAVGLLGCEESNKDKIRLPEAQAGEKPATTTTTAAQPAENASDAEARLTGTFEARRSSGVAASVGGVVRKVYVEEGDRVAEGDRLFDIDAANYRLQVEQAEAAVATADAQIATLKTELDRAEALLAKSAIAPSEVERLRGQFNAANAQRQQASVGLKMAQKARRDSLVKAPFAGIVTEVKVAEGEFASPGPTPLVEIDDEELLLRVSVPAEYVELVQQGATIEAEVPALEKTLELTVERISSRVEKSSRSFDVIAVPKERVESLRAGMFAEVPMATGGRE